MDFFLHNFIADMPGSQFIWLALIYCILVILSAKLCALSQDTTRNQPVPQIDTKADPYEIAYLRGGEKEVAATALFNLLQRERLVYDESGTVRVNAETSHVPVTSLEHIIVEQFAIPRKANQILFSNDIFQKLSAHCTAYEQSLIRKGMLSTSRYNQSGWLQVLLFLFLLEAPLLYKLMVAVLKGRTNIIFLILLLFMASITLVLVCRPARLTSLGKRYLESFKNALQAKKKQVFSESSAQSEAALMVALFGAGVLAGTSYGFFKNLFPRSSGNSSCSSCGSSCSSSGSGGSCGGGGCGGCGGGGD